jgi:hypothetical protein
MKINETYLLDFCDDIRTLVKIMLVKNVNLSIEERTKITQARHVIECAIIDNAGEANL